MRPYLVQWSQPFNPVAKIKILLVEDIDKWKDRVEKSGAKVVMINPLTVDEAVELQAKYAPLISR